MKAATMVFTVALAVASSAVAGTGRELIDLSGVRGGLVVHVGCGDGARTEQLAAGPAYRVHGLDRDPERVAAARQRLKAANLYGPVAADLWEGRHLPYIENLVNLLVVEPGSDLSEAEMMRVLVPCGVALVAGANGWEKSVKPRPDAMDEWTHYLHNPTNNAVAQDTLVGPPHRFQWNAGPRYARHHDNLSSVSAAVSANGRVFYILDDAPAISILTPPRWKLIARDAFNGTLLWERRLGEWFHHLHPLKSGPAELPRRLVAVGDRCYATLAIDAPVSALDAVTGEVVRTYPQTEGAEEILVADGVLFVRTGGVLVQDSAAVRRGRSPSSTDPPPADLLAIEAETGNVLWNKQHAVVKLTLAVDDARVVFLSGDRLVALDRATGEVLWRSEPVTRADEYPDRSGPVLVLYEDVVLFAGSEFAAKGNRSWAVAKDDKMAAYAAVDGRKLWEAPHPISGYASAEDLLVIDGVAWSGETTSGHAVGTFTGRDVRTGEIVGRFDPNVDTYWFHHRCYRGKATTNYLIMSRTGIEYIDPRKEHWDINHWVRGACLYGVLPANGLTYAPQHPCACFPEAKLDGFAALASGPPLPEPRAAMAALPRLHPGPAYGTLAEATAAAAADWPTYRGDNARSGHARTTVAADPAQAWTTVIGGRLSSPVVADGRLYVAAVDAHTVHALDATEGSPLWQYTAGARVDSPPTVHGGSVLFGSADGYVYCLRAEDGALVWRFRAAPSDQRMMWYDQLESVWPVHGSVLVQDGALVVVAGRSMFLDGGLRMYRLDPRTGELLDQRVYDERDSADDATLQDYARQMNMPVALTDILSSDGRYLYMRSQAFRLDGERLPLRALPYAGNPERYSIPNDQDAELAHLFSPTGFLDDSWWHRTYWIYGSRFLGGWAGYSQAGRVTPGGKILCFDDTKVYGFGRKPEFYRWTTPLKHHLWSAFKSPEAQRSEGGFRVAHNWTKDTALFARALLLADGTLFAAGPEDLVDEPRIGRRIDAEGVPELLAEQEAAFLGKRGGLFWTVDARTGELLASRKIDRVPVFDGFAAARNRLYMAATDGAVVCFAGE